MAQSASPDYHDQDVSHVDDALNAEVRLCIELALSETHTDVSVVNWEAKKIVAANGRISGQVWVVFNSPGTQNRRYMFLLRSYL